MERCNPSKKQLSYCLLSWIYQPNSHKRQIINKIQTSQTLILPKKTIKIQPKTSHFSSKKPQNTLQIDPLTPPNRSSYPSFSHQNTPPLVPLIALIGPISTRFAAPYPPQIMPNEHQITSNRIQSHTIAYPPPKKFVSLHQLQNN